MDRIVQEVRQAARRLLRSPGFAATAVLTLALAIGANSAVFTVVHRVVLNPLPYPESDRLIDVDHGFVTLNVPAGMGVTRGLYFHYSDRARTLDGIAAYDAREITLTGGGEPERLQATYTTAALTDVLRVTPMRGRWFSDREMAPGAPAVAVISYGLWMRRYGGDPSIVGRAVTLDGLPTAVVGVMPASFMFPDPAVDVWVPERITRESGFGTWEYDAVARLRSGTTLADARAELRSLLLDIPAVFPDDPIARGTDPANVLPVPRTLIEATVGTIARALWILLASVGVVLLVACANVANLFLVRAEARQREVAVRRALGAGRRGLAAYVLAESVLLSIAGGLAGLAIAWASVRLLVSIGPANLPRLQEIRVDGVVLAFTFGLCVLSAVVFGAVPLLHQRNEGIPLRDDGRTHTPAPGRHHARRTLIAAQVALALVLLVSSGLMARSFQKLHAVDPGFSARSALTFTVGLPQREYATRAAAVAAHQAVIDRLSALPEVAGASATSCLPLSGGCFGNTIRVESRPIAPGTVPPLALFRAVAPGYFDAMGIRVLRGRAFTRDEIAHGDPVAVISESLARTIFPNDNPIGERVASNTPPARAGEAPDFTWLTIVGVVADTPIRTPGEPFASSQLYMPMSIAGGPDLPRLTGPDVSVMQFVVRTTTPPLGLARAVRQAVSAVDPSVALSQLRTVQSLIDRSLSQTAFTMVLLSMAAGVALMLGMVGLYGVMSYIVSQRTGEIGVRVALGAEPGRIARMIVRQGATVTIVGIAIGAAGALAAGRLIESLLYGVSPRDPWIYALTALALFGVAILACWVPAGRASRLNPVEALRAS